jgi:hypothetical protein
MPRHYILRRWTWLRRGGGRRARATFCRQPSKRQPVRDPRRRGPAMASPPAGHRGACRAQKTAKRATQQQSCQRSPLRRSGGARARSLAETSAVRPVDVGPSCGEHLPGAVWAANIRKEHPCWGIPPSPRWPRLSSARSCVEDAELALSEAGWHRQAASSLSSQLRPSAKTLRADSCAAPRCQCSSRSAPPKHSPPNHPPQHPGRPPTRPRARSVVVAVVVVVVAVVAVVGR